MRGAATQVWLRCPICLLEQMLSEIQMMQTECFPILSFNTDSEIRVHDKNRLFSNPFMLVGFPIEIGPGKFQIDIF